MKKFFALISFILACGVYANGDAFHQVEESVYNGMKYFGASGDWISVNMNGYSQSELPAIYEKSGKYKIIVRQEIPNFRGVHGPKGFPFWLNGELTVKIKSWDGSWEKELGKKIVKNWAGGQAHTFTLDSSELKPGAYIVTADLPPHINSQHIFNPSNNASGSIGHPMLYGRNAMRLGVFSNKKPEEIFGVGNGMIHTSKHWIGMDVKNDLEARDLEPVMVGEGDSFHNAIIGCPTAKSLHIDMRGPTNNPSMNNPANPRSLNIFSDVGRKELLRRATATGKSLSKDAGVAVAKMGNEMAWFNKTGVNPSPEADASFRKWCSHRYNGDLAKANKIWGTNFKSWDEVRQPIHATKDITVEKKGAAAIDWYSGMGYIGKDLIKHLKENIEIAMDWYRWRTFATVKMWCDFTKEAKKYDKKTLYGNNYCWPNFFTHTVLPIFKLLDVAQLDCQYVNAYPRTLGAESEMIEILEMTESIVKDKPILGREIYVQPHYPLEMAALQNWAMVAHGMRVNLVFAWKPYSDHGSKVFKDGPRAWERKKDAVPMWFLIDTDGTRLPVYEGVKRSTKEIADFHKKHDALSLKRIRSRTAIYISDETSMYNMLITGDKPYLAGNLCHSRHKIAYGLRMGGARFEYIFDGNLDELTRENYDTVILPPTPRISEKGAKTLEAFIAAGGKRIDVEEWENDFFEKNPSVKRFAWWENEGGETGAKFVPGEGAPSVEVVVRKHEKTGRRFVFVLNKGGAGKGSLRGEDFKGVAAFTDAFTGEKCSGEFSLAPYGYKVLIMD